MVLTESKDTIFLYWSYIETIAGFSGTLVLTLSSNFLYSKCRKSSWNHINGVLHQLSTIPSVFSLWMYTRNSFLSHCEAECVMCIYVSTSHQACFRMISCPWVIKLVFFFFIYFPLFQVWTNELNCTSYFYCIMLFFCATLAFCYINF